MRLALFFTAVFGLGTLWGEVAGSANPTWVRMLVGVVCCCLVPVLVGNHTRVIAEWIAGPCPRCRRWFEDQIRMQQQAGLDWQERDTLSAVDAAVERWREQMAKDAKGRVN